MALELKDLDLPAEVIALIIEQSDSKTRSKWVTATRRSSALHFIALRSRWQENIITHRDLIACPGEADLMLALNDNLEIRRRLLPANDWDDKEAYLPAVLKGFFMHRYTTFIRHLTLDFTFRERPAERPAEHRGKTPWISSLVFTIQMLLPELTELKCLSHQGNLPQELLECIAANLSGTCRHLRFRWKEQPRKKFFHLDRRDAVNLTARDLVLDWRSIGNFEALTSLEIYYLSQGEGHRLATAVRRLSCLKRLVVTAATPLDFNYNTNNVAPPLQSFVDVIFPSSDENGQKSAG